MGRRDGDYTRCLVAEAQETPEGDGRPLPVLRSDVNADALTPPAEPRAIDRPAGATLPAPVLAAAGGFLMGVATYVVIRVVRAAARPRRMLRRRRKVEKALDVAATRSFLVDVHFLRR